MEKYILDTKDLYSNYFHFTDKKNLESIKFKGLILNIGPHAKNIEKTKKISFDGILLNLDLEANIDFRYDDKDEIKSIGYIKRHLEVCGYSLKYSDLNSTIMDRWNMHTLTNHIVNNKKIKVCYLKNGSSNLRDIFNYCLKNTKIDLENICLELCAYLKYKGV